MNISITVNIHSPKVFFGHTGKIVKSWNIGKYKKYRIKLDSYRETVDLYEDEIYFPDHEDRYNQAGCIDFKYD